MNIRFKAGILIPDSGQKGKLVSIFGREIFGTYVPIIGIVHKSAK